MEYQKVKKNQNIRYSIPISFFYEFINNNSKEIEFNSNKYLINKEFYKKIKLNKSLDIFFNKIKPCYHISKQVYIDNCNNYKKFLTIIRQLCKFFDLKYENSITYFNSNYENQYIITFEQNHINKINKSLRSLSSESDCSSNTNFTFTDDDFVYKSVSPIKVQNIFEE